MYVTDPIKAADILEDPGTATQRGSRRRKRASSLAVHVTNMKIMTHEVVIQSLILGDILEEGDLKGC